MSFERPSLETLIERSVVDIESRIPEADARLRASNLNVLSRVHAAATHGLYGYLDWISRQVMLDTADEEILLRHAAIWLPNGRVEAGYAIGPVVVQGSNGTVIEASAIFKRADGVTYSVRADSVVVSGEATVTVTAVEAGLAGNAAAGTTLTLESPIAGINASAQVGAGGISAGADIESIEALRRRVIDRIQQPPHGGAAHDYITWAKEVPGVTRAWAFPMEAGPGTMTVRFLRDGDADPIPGPAAVAVVQAYIDALRPVTVKGLYVAAPIPDALDFEIQSLAPNTAAVRAAVETELADLLSRESEPGGMILLSHIRAAISVAAGENDYVLIAPTASVTHAAGHMSVLGTVTWS